MRFAAIFALVAIALAADSVIKDGVSMCFGDYTLQNITQIADLNVEQLQSALGWTKAAAEELNEKYRNLIQQAEFLTKVNIPENWPSLIPGDIDSTDLSKFFLPSPQVNLIGKESVCGMFATAGCCSNNHATIMDQFLTVPVIKSFMDSLGDPATDCCARSVMTFLCGIQCGPNNYAAYNASFFELKDKSTIPVYINSDTCTSLFNVCKDKPTFLGMTLEQTVQMLGGKPGESFCNMIQDTQSFAVTVQGQTITIPKFHFIYGTNPFPPPGAEADQAIDLTLYLEDACKDLPNVPSAKATREVSGAAYASPLVGVLAIVALLALALL